MKKEREEGKERLNFTQRGWYCLVVKEGNEKSLKVFVEVVNEAKATLIIFSHFITLVPYTAASGALFG